MTYVGERRIYVVRAIRLFSDQMYSALIYFLNEKYVKVLWLLCYVWYYKNMEERNIHQS